MMSNLRDMKNIVGRIYRHESLAGIDLRNLYFSSMDFSRVELRRADLTGCCLNHALLDGCDLRDANLTGAKLSHASLNGAKLSGHFRRGFGKRRFIQRRDGPEARDQRIPEDARSQGRRLKCVLGKKLFEGGAFSCGVLCW